MCQISDGFRGFFMAIVSFPFHKVLFRLVRIALRKGAPKFVFLFTITTEIQRWRRSNAISWIGLVQLEGARVKGFVNAFVDDALRNILLERNIFDSVRY